MKLLNNPWDAVSFTHGIGFCKTWIDLLQSPQCRCLTDNISKPLALILSSSSDWNGALNRTQDAFATLAKNHTVCHRYIDHSAEINDHLKQLGQQKKIDVLVMRAHGGPILQQHAKDWMSVYSPRKDFTAFRSSLTSDATIIFYSCLNAATCGIDDLAGFVRSIAPPLATVYAPTQGIDKIEIQSGTPPKVRMLNNVTDVTYRSGVDGYCNNPHFGEAQIAKLKDLKIFASIGQVCEAAIGLASEAFKSTDSTIRNQAIALWEKLFKKGPTDSMILNYAIALWEKLFKKGQAVEAATCIASETFKSADSSICDNAIDLCRKLFEKDPGFKTSIEDSLCDLAEPFAKNGDDSTMNILERYWVIGSCSHMDKNSIRAAFDSVYCTPFALSAKIGNATALAALERKWKNTFCSSLDKDSIRAAFDSVYCTPFALSAKIGNATALAALERKWKNAFCSGLDKDSIRAAFDSMYCNPFALSAKIGNATALAALERKWKDGFCSGLDKDSIRAAFGTAFAVFYIRNILSVLSMLWVFILCYKTVGRVLTDPNPQKQHHFFGRPL